MEQVDQRRYSPQTLRKHWSEFERVILDSLPCMKLELGDKLFNSLSQSLICVLAVPKLPTFQESKRSGVEHNRVGRDLQVKLT
jgi:hypothetical protein